MFTMTDDERKKLVWTLKKRLFSLPADDVFKLAAGIPQTPDKDSAEQKRLNKDDEEDCIDHICAYMNSPSLLELEDEGLSQLLFIKDMIADMMQKHEQGEFSSESGTGVTATDANVSPPTVAPINTHPADTHPETTTTDLASHTSEYSSL